MCFVEAKRSLLVWALSWKDLGENGGLTGSVLADPPTDIVNCADPLFPGGPLPWPPGPTLGAWSSAITHLEWRFPLIVLVFLILIPKPTLSERSPSIFGQFSVRFHEHTTLGGCFYNGLIGYCSNIMP